MNDEMLVIDGARGVYVPQCLATIVDRTKWTGVSDEEWDILKAGPDHEEYWEVWSDVLDEARALVEGERYCLMQENGDLFLVNMGDENE